MIRDYFYVGGSYVEDTGAGGEVFANQMYVEHLVPPGGATQKWPLVFIHGQGQSGTVSSSVISHYLPLSATPLELAEQARWY